MEEIKKIYLYDNEGVFIDEADDIEGIIYHNSTSVKPIFDKDHPREIYNARWDKYTQTWHFEFKQEYINSKAKELDIEIVTLNSMSDDDIKSGKLPALDNIIESNSKIKKGAKK